MKPPSNAKQISTKDPNLFSLLQFTYIQMLKEENPEGYEKYKEFVKKEREERRKNKSKSEQK